MSVPKPDDSFVFVNVEPINLSNNENLNETEMEVEPRPPQMKSMHVVSNVRNRYARTVVTSKYVNPDKNAQQATFSIVLPDTAFIAGFVMEIKGKKYEAYVKEKEEAKQEYQAAVSSGRAAAHVAVSARDSNKFTVSVNVEPQSDVTFILTYEELLVRKHGKYEMVVNLHLAQLLEDFGVDIYINETRPIINVETPAIRSGNEITDKVTKNNFATIEKGIDGVIHVSFHPTSQQQKEMTNALPSDSNSNGISGQFVVEYDVERDPLGGEVLVNDGYFVHFFAPTELKAIPKHVVFVLDVSGSMQGRKIIQLKEAMQVILSELNPEDYFNIIKFENYVQILYRNNDIFQEANTSLPATAENISKAQKIVSSMQAGGGTNISDALISALSITSKGIITPEKKKNIQPIIVFLTDGQANAGERNSDRIIEMVLQRNDCENKAAIFTLAFGNDANKEFLKELAIKSSGFLRNIYEAADASLQLQDFYKQISSPLLTNVNFKYSEEVKEITKHKFDILFNGSEFVVTGKVDKIVDGFVVVEGSTLYGINDFRPTIIPICPTKEENEKYGNLERLWAYMTIKQLLDKKYEKLNSEKYAANPETPEKQALNLALKYSFVTPVTSLVVVKPEDDLKWGSVHVASSQCIPPGQVFDSRPRACGLFCPKLPPNAPQSGFTRQVAGPTFGGKPCAPPLLRIRSNSRLYGFAAASPRATSLSFGSQVAGPPPPPPPLSSGFAAASPGATSLSFGSQSFGSTVSAPTATIFGSSSNSQPSGFAAGSPGATSFRFGSNSQSFGSTVDSTTTFGSTSYSQLPGFTTGSPGATTFSFGFNSLPFGLPGVQPETATFGVSSISQPPDLAAKQSEGTIFGSSSNTCFSSPPSIASTFPQNASTTSFPSSENLWNKHCEADNTASKNMILAPHSPELRSMHVVSNVRDRYARTVMTSKYTNPDTQTLQTTFSFELPNTAFITGFVMEIKGAKYEANMRKKEQAKKEFQTAVTQGFAAAHLTDSADDSNKFTVSINIEPQSEVSFILTYEQLLVLKNSKCEIVTNLHLGHTLEDLEVDVKINDIKPIANLEAPILRSKNNILKSHFATVNKNKDGCIHVSFKPTVDQQKEIINILKESDENNGISAQIILEYKIETDLEDTEISVNDVPATASITDLIVIKSN